MHLPEKWIIINHKFSHYFTFGIGLGSHPNFIHSNENFFREKLREIILELRKIFPDEQIRILDIGCGKQTHLQALKDIHQFISAWGMDISAKELSANSFIKKHIIHDVCRDDYEDSLKEYRGFFHLVMSHNLLEHVPDPFVTHRMVYYILKPQGIAFHSYPTLYDPLMALSNLMPLKLAEKILFLIEPFRAGLGKFPTYYRKNRAFSENLMKWFSSMGFEYVHHRDYYGTSYLYSIFPLQWIADLFYLFVLKARLKVFCSHSIITLRRKNRP